MHVLFISSDIYDPDSIGMSGIFQKQFSSILLSKGYSVGLISSGVLPYFYSGKVVSGFSFKIEDQLNVIRNFSRFFFPARFLLNFPSYFLFKKFHYSFQFYISKFGIPDLIHCQNSLFAGYNAYLLRKGGLNIPTVITEHSSMYSRNRVSHKDLERVRTIIQSVDLFSVVSNSQKNIFETIFNFKDCYILNNQIDPLFEANDMERKRYSSGRFEFITVGNLDENKNQKIILIALKQLVQSNIYVNLKIVGDGPCLAELKKMTKEFKLEKYVNFLGKLNRYELLHQMNASNALIVSSFVETFGVAALEGLFLGLPCISTKCGGTSEFLNINNSIMVNPDDFLALSDAMKYIYLNIEKFDSELIKKEALCNFGQKAFFSKVDELYRKTISNFNYKYSIK
jgi:glycosyltransferase involved in cell wall biosynthesis